MVRWLLEHQLIYLLALMLLLTSSRTDHPDNIEIIRYDLANNVTIDEVGGLGAATSGTLEDINTGDFSGAVGRECPTLH